MITIHIDPINGVLTACQLIQSPIIASMCSFIIQPFNDIQIWGFSSGNLTQELTGWPFLLIYHIIQMMEIPVKKNLSISQWNCQLMASIWLWLEASFLETGLVPFQYKETTLLEEIVTSLPCFCVGFHILDFKNLTWLVGLCWSITLVVKCKTAVTPVNLLWSYCSLALSHRYLNKMIYVHVYI